MRLILDGIVTVHWTAITWNWGSWTNSYVGSKYGIILRASFSPFLLNASFFISMDMFWFEMVVFGGILSHTPYVFSSTVVLGYHNWSAFFLLIHDVLSLKYEFHHLSLLKPFAEIHLSITTPRWLWWKCWNLVTLGSKSGHFGFEIWPQIHEIMKLELKS